MNCDMKDIKHTPVAYEVFNHDSINLTLHARAYIRSIY